MPDIERKKYASAILVRKPDFKALLFLWYNTGNNKIILEKVGLESENRTPLQTFP